METEFEQDLLEMIIRHRNGHPDVEPEGVLWLVSM